MKKSITIFALFLVMVSLTSFTAPNEIGGRSTTGDIASLEIGGRSTTGDIASFKSAGRSTTGE